MKKYRFYILGFVVLLIAIVSLPSILKVTVSTSQPKAVAQNNCVSSLNVSLADNSPVNPTATYGQHNVVLAKFNLAASNTCPGTGGGILVYGLKPSFTGGEAEGISSATLTAGNRYATLPDSQNKILPWLMFKSNTNNKYSPLEIPFGQTITLTIKGNITTVHSYYAGLFGTLYNFITDQEVGGGPVVVSGTPTAMVKVTIQ